jgi:hypothetical protein
VMGWHHATGGGQERERESAEGVSRPIGSGPRPAGAGRGAPCRVAGPNRGRGEADWCGPSTVEGGRARRGPVGSGWGAREKEIERQGGGECADMRVRAAQCRVARFKLDLNRFKI